MYISKHIKNTYTSKCKTTYIHVYIQTHQQSTLGVKYTYTYTYLYEHKTYMHIYND